MEQSDRKSTPLSPGSLLPILAAEYELPAPVGCALLSSGLNDVFWVTTGGETFILQAWDEAYPAR